MSGSRYFAAIDMMRSLRAALIPEAQPHGEILFAIFERRHIAVIPNDGAMAAA